MRLAVKPFLIACAVLWGGSILLVGIVNLIAPPYGAEFLRIASSLYPGFGGGEPYPEFRGSGTVGSVFVGTLYGLVDGAICGGIFAWIYNSLIRAPQRA